MHRRFGAALLISAFALTPSIALAEGAESSPSHRLVDSSSVCDTAGARETCEQTIQAVEPGTLILFGTAIASVGGVSLFGRKRRSEDSSDWDQSHSIPRWAAKSRRIANGEPALEREELEDKMSGRPYRGFRDDAPLPRGASDGRKRR